MDTPTPFNNGIAQYKEGHFGFPAHVDAAPPLLRDKPSLMVSDPDRQWLTASRPNTNERRCCVCGEWKDKDDFSVSERDPIFQRQRTCKPCASDQFKSWYYRNRTAGSPAKTVA